MIFGLERLLQHPRNPNVRDTAGDTPLHHAAEEGHVESMLLLLEVGAERDVQDTTAEGWTLWTPLLQLKWAVSTVVRSVPDQCGQC